VSGAGSDKIALTDDRMMELVPSEVQPSKQDVELTYMSKEQRECYMLLTLPSCSLVTVNRVAWCCGTPASKHWAE